MVAPSSSAQDQHAHGIKLQSANPKINRTCDCSNAKTNTTTFIKHQEAEGC